MPDDGEHGVDQPQLRAALNRYLLVRRSPDARERQDARLALVAVLEQAGWEPPPALRAALLSDERARDGASRRTA